MLHAVAKVFVDESINALFGDPQVTVARLVEKTTLSDDDVKDALHELGGMIMADFGIVLPRDELFATFDKFWREWDPAVDALRLAADLLNDDAFPTNLQQISDRYGWPARRLNPAVAYLINREIVRGPKLMGAQPWLVPSIMKTDATRRFVRSRS